MFCKSFSEDKHLRWFEITSETDKNMAVIADVHTVFPSSYLEEGVGPASEIFVVVPIGGKLYLTRGAIFSNIQVNNSTTPQSCILSLQSRILTHL